MYMYACISQWGKEFQILPSSCLIHVRVYVHVYMYLTMGGRNLESSLPPASYMYISQRKQGRNLRSSLPLASYMYIRVANKPTISGGQFCHQCSP